MSSSKAPFGAFFVSRVRLPLLLLFWLVPFMSLASGLPPAAAIASAHPDATRAGHAILAAGGNAFDAAVAVTAALAVVEPYGSGLGGGGFWLLHRASDGLEVMLDGRETAPGAAHRDMYLDATGQPVPRLSIDGALAAGIPGTPAALAHLAEKYGRLPLERSLAPAIRLAQDGVVIDSHYERYVAMRAAALAASPAAAAIFLDDGAAPQAGWLLRQPDLAATLERLAEEGRDGFYAGPLAARMVESVRRSGGIWTLHDLAGYRVVEREPVRFNYRDVAVTAATLPSAGGVVLAEMLNILAGYPLDELDEADRVHLVVEAMRRAYRDRAAWLGDPAFVDVPQQQLLSREYAAGLRAGIHPERATPSDLLPGIADEQGGRQTSHFSILDGEGNRVAATLSINYLFGSAFVPPGSGVLLNDEMDDFSLQPGVPNVYGLVGNEANAIAAGKRMLSSMTPLFLDDGHRLALAGTPGGSRIITMMLLAALEFESGAEVERLVGRPRYHHQYLPDIVSHEPDALDAGVVAELARRGHVVRAAENPWGNMQAVLWDRTTQRLSAASDPRGGGLAEVR